MIHTYSVDTVTHLHLKGTHTKISEVTIMRLYFESAGVKYNLGVVSNKQTGDDKPDQKVEEWDWNIFGDSKKSFWDSLLDFLREFGKAFGIFIGAVVACAVIFLIVWGIFRIIEIFKKPKVVLDGSAHPNNGSSTSKPENKTPKKKGSSSSKKKLKRKKKPRKTKSICRKERQN